MGNLVFELGQCWRMILLGKGIKLCYEWQCHKLPSDVSIYSILRGECTKEGFVDADIRSGASFATTLYPESQIIWH